MSHSQSVFKQYISPQMIASSFTGMVMALPLVFALSSSASRVNGYQAPPVVQNQSSAQVSDADFARFAYAYDKGYQAHVANVSTASVTTPGSCSDPQSSDTSGPVSSEGAWAPMPSEYKSSEMSHAPLAAVVNSYNSYVSTINNSSSVTNTNSNNVVGSNNMTKTDVKVINSNGVTVDNSQHVAQVAAVDSTVKDVNNTKTDTNIANDSFNSQTKNVTIDSGNTSTSTTNVTNNVTKTIDSNNTTNVTKTIDSNNTMNMMENSNNTTTTDTTNITNTENKAIGSYNTSVDVNLGNGKQGGSHGHEA